MDLSNQKLGDTYTEEQYKKATILVSSSHALAVSSFIPLMDKYSELEVIPKSGQLELWDFLYTMACIGIAFTRLARTVLEDEIDGNALAIKKRSTIGIPTAIIH